MTADNGGGQEAKRLRFAHWPEILRSVMMALWAVYFLLLAITGACRYYIRPGYMILPLAGGGLLVAMIWVRRHRLRQDHTHDRACLEGYEPCAYRHRFQMKFLAPMAIFFLPLMFAALVPPAELNALIAERRGLNLQPVRPTPELTEARRAATTQPQAGPVPTATVEQVRSAVSRGVGLGQTVSTQGMVMHPADRSKYPHLPDRAVFLTHFIMTCCAADATTASLVLLPPPAGAPEAWPPAHGTWNTVTGTAALIDWDDGTLLPALRVQTVVLQERPQDPFLYK